jgi:hypothetical protein
MPPTEKETRAAAALHVAAALDSLERARELLRPPETWRRGPSDASRAAIVTSMERLDTVHGWLQPPSRAGCARCGRTFLPDPDPASPDHTRCADCADLAVLGAAT